MILASKPFTNYVRAIRSRFFSSSYRRLYSTRLPDHDIRLLTILPSHDADAPIECELCQYKVSTAPPYEGLSYVWGDPKDVVTVICNGIKVKVTKSLRNALWRIRDPEEKKTIWADALCMNQRDVKEKNIHVPLMGRVFSRATNTVIHLGEASEWEALEAEAGLEAIVGFMEEFRQQANLPADDEEAFYELIMATLSEEALPSLSWDAIMELYDAGWFSRTWCVQEIMLARDTALESYAIYGHIRIPYQRIAKVALFLIVAGKCGFEFARKLYLSDPIAVIELLDHLDQEDRNLLQILDSFSGHLASDPRDKVYGVLGILKQRFGYDPEGINVDYTKSVAQVYIDTAIEILRTKQNLELLDYIAHSDNFERETEYPTWVPRWDQPRGWVLFADDDMDVFRNTCSASSSSDRQVPISWAVQGNRLLVSGSQHDHVSRILPLFDSNLELTFERYWRQTQQIRSSCFDCQDELLAMARTFKIGRIATLVHYKEANDAQKESFMADFLAYVHQLMPECSPNCPGVPKDSMYTIDANGTKRMGFPERYASLLEDSCSGRCFFETTQGDYGVGPDYIRPGDSIVGLMGGSSPYALRPKGENYLALGSVYIDRLMDGEYFRQKIDGGMREQFTLI